MKGLFTPIDTIEAAEPYIKWAREKYKPFTLIEGTWHPVVQAECLIINLEASDYYGKWPDVNLLGRKP